MQEDQHTEVEETTERFNNGTIERQTISTRREQSGSVIFSRIIWYIAGVIMTLLALRMVLQLLGANNQSGFVSFIYDISGFFAAPFFGIFSYTPSYGNSYFETSTLVAIAVYALMAWGISKLATITK